MRNTLSLSQAADVFGASFFKNSARPSGYLKSPTALKDQAAVTRLRENWSDIQAGAHNAGKTALLENGMEWVPLQLNPEEAQYLETRRYQILEVVRMFRIPPHKLGDYSNSHYNNIEASNLDYYQTTLKPWATLIEQEINFKLFKPADRRRLFVKHDLGTYLEPLPKDITHHRRTLLECGIISRNEWREAEGLNSLGPEGDSYYITKQISESSTNESN
jgi:HK97 family phage portal protein